MKNLEKFTNVLTEFFEKFSSWEHGVVRNSSLTLPQMHTIEILGTHGRLRMKELAAKMGVTTGTLTVLVDRLEDKKYVERLPHETDRRSIVVALTDLGREAFGEHHRLHMLLTSELTQDFSEAELASLCELLERMSARI